MPRSLTALYILIIVCLSLILSPVQVNAGDLPLPISSGQPDQSVPVTTVVGQNDPLTDYDLLNDALQAAAPDDTVTLEGTFDLSQCPTPITLDKKLTLTAAADPNADPAQAAQLVGCGPVFNIDLNVSGDASLVIEKLWFRDQIGQSIMIERSLSPLEILNNRFTGVVPLSISGSSIRFAVIAAPVGPKSVESTIALQENTIDWSGVPQNDTFVGDDNGFALAGTDASLIIQDNTVITLGEGIEIEGNTGQDNVYLVQGNDVQTMVVPSASGESEGVPGSVAEGKAGGHPAAVKLHSNEGSFTISQNMISLSGLSNGVCIMATTRNDQALNGDRVNIIEENQCMMTGQLAGILGAWGRTEILFPAASLSGALVTDNQFSGSGALGIAMIDRSAVAGGVGAVTNDGHDNVFTKNDFSGFVADTADIGFDSQTVDNTVYPNRGDEVIDLGANQIVYLQYLPVIFKG